VVTTPPVPLSMCFFLTEMFQFPPPPTPGQSNPDFMFRWLSLLVPGVTRITEFPPVVVLPFAVPVMSPLFRRNQPLGFPFFLFPEARRLGLPGFFSRLCTFSDRSTGKSSLRGTVYLRYRQPFFFRSVPVFTRDRGFSLVLRLKGGFPLSPFWGWWGRDQVVPLFAICLFFPVPFFCIGPLPLCFKERSVFREGSVLQFCEGLPPYHPMFPEPLFCDPVEHSLLSFFFPIPPTLFFACRSLDIGPFLLLRKPATALAQSRFDQGDLPSGSFLSKATLL